MARRPLDGAVPSEGGSQHQMEGLDVQGVGQARLGGDLVARGQPREARAPGASVRRGGRGAGRALAPTQDVGGDDEVALGVDRAPGTDELGPPSWARVTGTGLAGDVGVSGQGVQDEDGVVTLGAQPAPGLECQHGARQDLAALQGEVPDLHEVPVAGVVARAPGAGGGSCATLDQLGGGGAYAWPGGTGCLRGVGGRQSVLSHRWSLEPWRWRRRSMRGRGAVGLLVW